MQHCVYAWHRICYVCEVTEGIFWRWPDPQSFRDKINFLQNWFCCFTLIPCTNALLFSFIDNRHKSVTCFSIWIFTIGSVWRWRVDHTARNCVSEGQWRFDGTSFTIWSHLGWYIISELRCVFEMSVSFLLYRNVYHYLLSHILMIDNDNNFLNFCKIALTWKYFKSRVTCVAVT